jgi:hypothetical protein
VNPQVLLDWQGEVDFAKTLGVIAENDVMVADATDAVHPGDRLQAQAVQTEVR